MSSDPSRLSKGDPSAFLPVVDFTLTSFSGPFAEQLIAAGLELTGKTDLRFTDTFYKVTSVSIFGALREELKYASIWKTNKGFMRLRTVRLDQFR